MPNERIRPETDGDPSTALEDTKHHGRTGFLVTSQDFTRDLEREKQPNKNRP